MITTYIMARHMVWPWTLQVVPPNRPKNRQPILWERNSEQPAQLELRVNENRPEEELLRHDVMRHHETSCTRLRQVRFTERQDERAAAAVRSRGGTEYQYCK